MSSPHCASACKPLHIDSVAIGTAARLGMCHCPGRQRRDEAPRCLRHDLAAIRAWGASRVLTLLQTAEFASLGVPGFAQAMAATPLRWLHVPIADMGTPDAASLAAWRQHRGELRAALQRGDQLLVHCAAGLGRTGMLVARLLVDSGMSPPDAIARVRRARAGSIETAAQAAFVAEDRLFSLSGV